MTEIKVELSEEFGNYSCLYVGFIPNDWSEEWISCGDPLTSKLKEFLIKIDYPKIIMGDYVIDISKGGWGEGSIVWGQLAQELNSSFGLPSVMLSAKNIAQINDYFDGDAKLLKGGKLVIASKEDGSSFSNKNKKFNGCFYIFHQSIVDGELDAASGIVFNPSKNLLVEKSSNIVIRFPMTKDDDGNTLLGEDISELQRYYPRDISYFILDLDYDKFGKDLDSFDLKEVTIIYNGVDKFDEINLNGETETQGLKWNPENGSFEGYTAPIIKFTLENPVDVKLFLKLVKDSCLHIASNKQKINGSNGLYFNDHNDLAHVLDKDETKSWIKILKRDDAYDGRKFDYISDCNIFPLNMVLNYGR